MALKSKSFGTGSFELKFKTRGTEDKKKVMIYGNDGTGVDDTNFTSLPIVELDMSNDRKAYKFVKDLVESIKDDDRFDTIILDGVTSYLEMLVSKANGLKKYSDRAERFQDVLRCLQSSGKHLIFIGQADMEVIYSDEYQSNKMVIKINSIVNEKYHCIKTPKGEYKVETVKFRGVNDS